MRFSLSGEALILALSTSALAAAAPPAPGLAVAVIDFESALPSQKDFGPAFADILSARLSLESSLTVLERASLGKVLAEQKLSLSGLVDAKDAARAGRLLVRSAGERGIMREEAGYGGIAKT